MKMRILSIIWLSISASLLLAQDPEFFNAVEFKRDTYWNTADPFHRIPALVITQKGTLILQLQDRKSQSDDADNFLVITRSFDYGETWEQPTKIAVPDPDPRYEQRSRGHGTL